MKWRLSVLWSGLAVFLLCHAASAAPLPVKVPKISVSPASVNYGNVKLGATSGKVITIRNTGTAGLVISAVSISGPNASEFSATHGCTTIPAGGLCAINAAFSPTVLHFGKKSATMGFSTNDPKKPTIAIKLSGNVPPPKISVAPASVNFKTVQAGSASQPVKMTVKNTGPSDLVIGDITMAGPNASDFMITDDCTTVPSGGLCTVTAKFVPTSQGAKSAVLRISSNDPARPTGTVKLLGKATPPAPGTSTWDSGTWDGSTWAE